MRVALRLALTAIVLLAAAASWAVDVNRGNQAELEALRGVGPGLAERILAERQKREFRDWQDFIERVGGVGPGSAARLSAAGLRVGGAAYVPRDKQAPAPAPKR